MLNDNLDAADEAALHALVTDQAAESTMMDFKATPHDKSEQGKVELAKDICAFANADGGDLVIGISCKDYVATGVVPIATEAFDALVRRYTETLNAKVEPRIHGIRFKEVRLAKGGYAAVVRVPSSYDGPHTVRATQVLRRFVIRNGTSISDMSFDQIRAAFDRTATLAERARKFIGDRLDEITARRTSNPILGDGPIWALHVVPISGVSGRMQPDLREIHSRTYGNFMGEDWGDGSRTFNFDGLVIYAGGHNADGHYAYAHVFRNGAIEYASLGGARQPVQQGGPERSLVWSLGMTRFFWQSATISLSELRRMGFSGPALLNIALLSVKDYELGIGDVFHRFARSAADRQSLVVPPAWIESLEAVDLSETLRPMLDSIWQAFDAARCLDFDEQTGKYKPRIR